MASPIVVQGTVYIGAADKQLYALDAATGRQRWAFATQDWIVSAVAVAGDRVIVASQDSRLHVVGAETGRRRLLYETGMGGTSGSAPRSPESERTSVLLGPECGPSIGKLPPTHGSQRCGLADQPVPLGYALDTPCAEGQRVVETRRRRRRAHAGHCP